MDDVRSNLSLALLSDRMLFHFFYFLFFFCFFLSPSVLLDKIYGIQYKVLQNGMYDMQSEMKRVFFSFLVYVFQERCCDWFSQENLLSKYLFNAFLLFITHTQHLLTNTDSHTHAHTCLIDQTDYLKNVCASVIFKKKKPTWFEEKRERMKRK